MSEASNTSLTAMAKALREGECVSRTRRIEVKGMAKGEPAKSLAAMRNAMNQIASRAREKTERGYRVESGTFMTHDGAAVMATVTITCMEDEGEDDI